jgi:hypothetical protein
MMSVHTQSALVMPGPSIIMAGLFLIRFLGCSLAFLAELVCQCFHAARRIRRTVAMTIRLAMAAIFSIASSEASAIVRYMVQGMTCAEVQQALDRDGIAILYRQGESGIVLYDRFVKDGSLCQALTTTASEKIAVADTDECPVRKCIEVRRFGG